MIVKQRISKILPQRRTPAIILTSRYVCIQQPIKIIISFYCHSSPDRFVLMIEPQNKYEASISIENFRKYVYVFAVINSGNAAITDECEANHSRVFAGRRGEPFASQIAHHFADFFADCARDAPFQFFGDFLRKPSAAV